LHMVEEHEKIDLRHAVQVPEPGQEMGLVDRDNHCEFQGYGRAPSPSTGVV
jgi:hypothetical protein